jgi:serine/threonine protein kinase
MALYAPTCRRIQRQIEYGWYSSFLCLEAILKPLMQLSDVAQGLAYLHDQRVVHGDVKGLNILISRDVRAMLCDFGLAKAIDHTVDETQDSVGTWAWMSPERLQGGGPGRSFKDDVYAFGMTIYEV